jgi:TRAP-type C4-dicarboxylate transport system substrate-binding protein
VYSRACLSRTVVIVVALLLAVASANAVAREFRAAGTQSEDCPTVEALRYIGRLIAERSGDCNQIRAFHSRQSKALEQRSRSQAESAGVTTVTDFDRKPIEAAMAGTCDEAERDPADAQLISRIRKVE